MADNNPKKPIPPASTQRTTMVMVIILLAVAFFVGSQFMRTGAMGTTVTDQLITSEFTQAVEQGRVKVGDAVEVRHFVSGAKIQMVCVS